MSTSERYGCAGATSSSAGGPGFRLIQRRTICDVICDCSCEDGCPSCVGSSVPSFAMTDLDSAVRGRIPHKAGARVLLEALLGK